MQKLLNLFTALRMLPSSHQDDRTEATLQLMEYLQQTERADKYVKYIHGIVIPLSIYLGIFNQSHFRYNRSMRSTSCYIQFCRGWLHPPSSCKPSRLERHSH